MAFLFLNSRRLALTKAVISL
ncbi:hypothetical protein R3I93_022341 [Phoxinus phoxinus]|uniref:Uncharacterized protein n=1 Tax=Phoxinus phoxinus TaxID=58324 RepID=A0AAN9GS93_9TELE